MKITLALLSLAITTTSAAAQDTLDDPYKSLRAMVKTYEAKTTPVDPNAPAPSATVQSAGPNFTRTPLAPAPASNNNALLDGCVITAVGRLPKAEGLRVINTSYEYRSSHKQFEFWNVMVSADLNGHKGHYQWICRVYNNVSAQLIGNR